MPETDAIVMNNLFPTPSYVTARNGYVPWLVGLAGPVQTVAAYSPASGTRKLFAACGGSIYDATSQGSAGAAVVSGLSSNWWQFVNFGAGGSQYLVMVNGIDPMLAYNGQGWESVGNGTGGTILAGSAIGTTVTITDVYPHGLATGQTVTVSGAVPSGYNVSNVPITVVDAYRFSYTVVSFPGGTMTGIGSYTYAPSITGVSTSTFINVNAFMGRLFFIVKNSMQVWFLPLLSVGGAATMLDLSTQTLLGGYLVAMATWTVETTSGMTQMACFLTSEGEVLVYQGNDPTYASSWYQVGNFRVGRPVGYRCCVKVGSDVCVITVDGLVPLSKAMLSDRSQREIALTDKIQNLINNDAAAYSGYQGWQPILSPLGNKIILNVPAPSGAYQYVMNTITGAWCIFTGWAANCFALMGDALFMGTQGMVAQVDTGTSDNGQPIHCSAVQAPSYFNNHDSKHFTLARPVMQSNGPIRPAFQINVDYDTTVPVNQFNFVTGGYTPWGSRWGSPWSSVNRIYKNWFGVGSVGYAGSCAIAFSVAGAAISWQATDVAFTTGGPL